MGMGYMASYADVIEWAEVKKLCPQEAEAFEKELADWGVSLEDFCQGQSILDMQVVTDAAQNSGPTLSTDDLARCEDHIEEAWETLTEAFALATEVDDFNLNLEAGYHNSEDEGDRPDQVKGGYFHVEGVYNLTPAGEKFEHLIRRAFYVTMG